MSLSSALIRRFSAGAAVVAALGAMATCVEQPTAPPDAGIIHAPVAPAAATTSIVHTLLTSGSSPVNQKVCTTASIAPAANALVTVAVMGHHGPTAAPSPTVSGGGMASWTQVATVTFDDLTSPHKRLSIFRGLSPSPGSGQLKITFASSQANCQWIVSQWKGVETSGTNGANAIGQTGSARANAVNGLLVTLGAFTDSRDVAYGVFGVRKTAAAITPGAGFTEIAELPSTETPPSDLQAEWSAGDNTVDAKWTKLLGAGLALEIKVAGAPPKDPVASVEVSPDSIRVAVGDTVRLAASTLDAGGEPLGGRTVSWTTDRAPVATVSSTGLVTAVGVGSATITATSEGKSGTAHVTVTSTDAPVAAVEVTPTSPTVAVGGTVQLTATLTDAGGGVLTGRTVAWATAGPGVATVSATGLVTGVAAGSTTVTATSEGKAGMASVTVSSLPRAAVEGAWSSVFPSPIVQLHTHLLPDGRVLSWGHAGSPQVWDPATGAFTAVPSPSLLFCSGEGFLPDGRLLVAGGHITNGHGLANTNIFDPATSSWQAGPLMAKGRWYPTLTTLPSGNVLAMSGRDSTGAIVGVPEIWNGSTWRALTTANLSLQNYPRTFVAPNGRIFYAGADVPSRWLDLGTGQWSDGPSMHFGERFYGSAVMYEPGKILYVGGGATPTSSAEVINLYQPNPQWTYTTPMAYARTSQNATLLPTGDVLVTGGSSLADRANPAGAVNVAELWSPATGQWSQLASSAPLLRGYHSTSLLLPDGRVLHAGGGDGGGAPDNFNYEIYSPPYLFRGTRPAVSGATPNVAAYNQTLTVATPDGASIAKVTLIRLGAVTHAFDQAQRLIPLAFSQTAGGLSVTLPSSQNIAPPGPYMLFLVSADGVPSIGRIVRLQ